MAPGNKSSKRKAASVTSVGSKKPTKPKQVPGQYLEGFIPIHQSYSVLSSLEANKGKAIGLSEEEQKSLQALLRKRQATIQDMEKDRQESK